MFVVLSLFSSLGWGCICDPLSDKDAYERANGVFLVQITQTQYTERTEKGVFSFVSAKYKLIETLKGNLDPPRELRSDKTVCGHPLIAGDYYIIFSVSEEYVHLNNCTNSRWVNLVRDKELIDALRKPDEK